MIHEFRVKNYLSFKDEQCLNFEASKDRHFEEYYCVEVRPGVKLLKLGVIYGANAAGKTNLLVALNFLRDTVLESRDSKSEEIDFVPFLFDDKCKDAPGEFSLSFFVNGVRYVYTLHVTKDNILFEELRYYPWSRSALFFSRKTSGGVAHVTFGKTLGLKRQDKLTIQGNAIGNTSVIASYAKSNVKSEDFEAVYDWFRKSLKRIVTPVTDLFFYTSKKVEDSETCKNFVIDLLNLADFNISNIKIEEEEVEVDDNLIAELKNFPIPERVRKDIIERGKFTAKDINFLHQVQNEIKALPYKLESQGTKRFYGLSGLLNELIREQIVLLVDEIENSLHYELLSHFLKVFLFNSDRSQLIFTTHNIELLAEEFIRRDAVWLVEKNTEGASEVYSLADFDFPLEKSIYDAYKVGKFGAKPRLGGISLRKYGEKTKK